MKALYSKLNAMHAALRAIPKFVKLDDSGNAITNDATSHAAVLIPHAGIIVWPHSLGNGNETHASAETLCRDLRAMGYADWRLASRDDWVHILDLTRSDPAIDAAMFPGVKPRWHWTSTLCAWSKNAAGVASAAWYVYAYDGYVAHYGRGSYDGFALAVRSAGQ